jgi:hypothetical protein
VILQSDGINGMLIFLMDELNLTTDGKTDTNKDNRELLFELRLSYLVLSSLADNINVFEFWEDTGFNIGSMAKGDNKLKESWFNFHNKLKEVSLNTSKPMSNKDHESLTDSFNGLIVRVKRTRYKGDTNE